jgi:hypothetical protein
MSVVNFREEIIKVACDLFEKSGRVEGLNLDNWLEAERIVTAQHRQRRKVEAEISAKKMASPTKTGVTRKTETKAKSTKLKK